MTDTRTRKPRSDSSEVAALVPRMKELFDSGRTIKEIAARLDFSEDTVRKRLASIGVVIKKPPAPESVRRSKLLSPEEVEKLRKLVGFDPVRDVEVRSENYRRKS